MSATAPDPPVANQTVDSEAGLPSWMRGLNHAPAGPSESAMDAPSSDNGISVTNDVAPSGNRDAAASSVDGDGEGGVSASQQLPPKPRGAAAVLAGGVSAWLAAPPSPLGTINDHDGQTMTEQPLPHLCVYCEVQGAM